MEYQQQTTEGREYTTCQYAALKNLSYRTVLRYIANGTLKVRRYSKRCIRIIDEQPTQAA